MINIILYMNYNWRREKMREKGCVKTEGKKFFIDRIEIGDA